MKFVIVFAIFVASSQSAPADFKYQSEKELANAANLKKLLNNAYDNAEKHAKSVAGEYQNTYGDVQKSVSSLSSQDLSSALKTASEKVSYYMKNLQTIMNDRQSSPEDKAHQAISSLTPVLDGILSDFSSSASDIENLLKTVSVKAQEHANQFQQSAIIIVDDSQNAINEFRKSGQPEISNIFNAMKNDVKSQQSELYNNVKPAIEETKSQFNEFLNF